MILGGSDVEEAAIVQLWKVNFTCGNDCYSAFAASGVHDWVRLLKAANRTVVYTYVAGQLDLVNFSLRV